MDKYIPTDDGRWVNEKFVQIAEIIHDWDPEFELAWIPPEHRPFIKDKPYAVVHKPANGRAYVAFKLEEDQLDERVLARLWAGDTHRHDVLANIESMEAAKEAMRLKELMDREEERKELVAGIVGSKLHTVKHNGKVFRK